MSLSWDLPMCTVLLKTAVSNSILSPPLFTSQTPQMLCVACVSSAYSGCCQLANLDCKTLLSANCILPFRKCSGHLSLCNINQSTVRTSPSFSLCHISLMEFYELSAANRCFHSPLRQPQLTVGVDAVAFLLPFTSVLRATAPSIPASDFLLSFKTMCETLLCRNSSLSKFKDD